MNGKRRRWPAVTVAVLVVSVVTMLALLAVLGWAVVTYSGRLGELDWNRAA